MPEERYNWIYDEASDSFEEASKAFYYYSQYDTIPVSKEEYEELKGQYITKFGGWEKIVILFTSTKKISIKKVTAPYIFITVIWIRDTSLIFKFK